MGILTRFKDIMSANINALLDKCEDPEKMIDQYMRNLESDLGKVKGRKQLLLWQRKQEPRENLTNVQNRLIKCSHMLKRH